MPIKRKITALFLAFALAACEGALMAYKSKRGA